MKDTYIQAVLQMINDQKDATQVISGLKKTLNERGHDRLYASILRGVLRVLEARSGVATTLIVANEATQTEHKAAIAAALEELGAETEPAVATDDTLIGGFVVERNSRRIDQSYKSKLITLYRSLTS